MQIAEYGIIRITKNIFATIVLYFYYKKLSTQITLKLIKFDINFEIN